MGVDLPCGREGGPAGYAQWEVEARCGPSGYWWELLLLGADRLCQALLHSPPAVLRLNLSPDTAKADSGVADHRGEGVPHSGANRPRKHPPRPATYDAGYRDTLILPRRTIRRRTIIIAMPVICAPLRNIPEHIVKPPRVTALRGNRLRLSIGVPFKPSNLRQTVRANRISCPPGACLARHIPIAPLTAGQDRGQGPNNSCETGNLRSTPNRRSQRADQTFELAWIVLHRS